MHYNLFVIYMAGTMTHFKFIEDLNKKLKLENYNLFLLAGQGHDLLFFIKLSELKNFTKRKEIINIIADNKFDKTIEIWQKEILKTKNKNLEILMYGYIAHHILDHYVHPYINKISNNFKKLNHETLESIIDYILLNPYNYKFPKYKLNKDVKEELNKIFFETYNIKNIGTFLNNGINNLTRFIKVYRLDKFGIKKQTYKLIDGFLKNNKQKYEFLAFRYNEEEIDFVKKNNLKEFNKLYKQALEESIKIIKEIRKNINNKKITKINDISAI